MSTDADVGEGASPNEVRDPATRAELKRAWVWIGSVAAVALLVLLIQPLLVIFAALVFASMLDGGVRLLGRVLRIGRGWRLMIVAVLVAGFLLGVIYMMGMQITAQFAALRHVVETQGGRLTGWLGAKGLMPSGEDVGGMVRQGLGSVGKLTSYLGTALGAVTTGIMILALGLFIAAEPRLYERGLLWLIPRASRDEVRITVERMAVTLRRLMAGRLLGMAAEGVLTWAALALGGVPMALLLGVIDFVLAFIPNIGSAITGVLMVAVGFSAGTHTGLWAIGAYLVVQAFDGYVLIPTVAKRTVDLPPALTLAAQVLASALLGVLGLALADPLMAMLKVALERRAERAGQG